MLCLEPRESANRTLKVNKFVTIQVSVNFLKTLAVLQVVLGLN